MKKSLVPVLMLAFTGLGLASCGGGDDSTSTKNLYVQTYNNADPNMSNLWKPGFDDFSSTYGFKSSWDDSGSDDSKGVSQLKSAVASGNYDAYAINVVSQTNGTTYLNEIKKANAPVVFWNRELAKSDGSVDVDLMKSYDNCYYVGIESAEGGRYEGKAIADYITANGGISKFDRNGDGKIGVWIEKGEDGHADAEARCIWSPVYLDAYLTNASTTDAAISASYVPTGNLSGASIPGITFSSIEIIGSATAKNTGGSTWDPNTAATHVANALAGPNGGEIDVVLSNNDGMAVQIAKNQQFINSGALIAGIDALDDAITQIKTNKQYVASIRNDGRLQSKVVLQALKNMVNGVSITTDMDKIEEFTQGVVTTKAEWLTKPNSLWYDSENKAFRVHHVTITASNVNELA